MKTKVLALALAAMTMFGTSAMAQKCADKQNCVKKECKEQKAFDGNKMYQPREFTDFAFEGILLSVDQQDKVNALNAEMKAKKEACREAAKADCKKDCKKADCKKDDCKKDCKKDEKRQCRQDGRREYIAKVKEILTPEQYTVFLENIVNMPRQPKGMHESRMMRHGDRKCAKEMKRMGECKNIDKAAKK